MPEPDPKKHLVAVFGGAVSGAEAAYQLTQRGLEVVVFDQNLLPYGKIEDGLPKWHAKLRDKEEKRIDEKLSHPLVHFVPGIRLGRDIAFEELVKDWGFSAILLAIGAWRDRPLPVSEIDDFLGKGFYYQNPLIYWYNHKHEPGYAGPQFDLPDGSIIIGGGLASLDVAKVIMFELVEKALLERGMQADLFSLDRSIAQVLEEKGLTLEDLGIKGCTIYYRRRLVDMPLSPLPADTPEQRAKAEKVTAKILNNYRDKYLFNVEPLHVPVDKIVEDGQLKGLVFQKTRLENGRVISVPGSEYEVQSPLVISSIGSIPEHIGGIPMDGQVYHIIREDCCRLEGFDHVFAIGNAVTGRGNIRESLLHGREVTQAVIDQYFEEDGHLAEALNNTANTIAQKVSIIADKIDNLTPPSPAQRERIFEHVSALQEKAGYSGDFEEWVKNNLPVRLESMVGH